MLDREQAHKLVDQIFNEAEKAPGDVATVTFSEPAVEERKLPEGKRAVRTKTTGDMVYVLDEVKKTRSWVKSPEVLASVGFDMSDVVEVDTDEFAKYSMAAPTYRVE